MLQHTRHFWIAPVISSSILWVILIHDTCAATFHACPPPAQCFLPLLLAERSALNGEIQALAKQAEAQFNHAGYDPEKYKQCVPLFEAILKLQRHIYPESCFPNGHEDLAETHSVLGRCFAWMRVPSHALAHTTAAVQMARQLKTNDNQLLTCLADAVAAQISLRDYAHAKTLAEESIALSLMAYSKDYFPYGHPAIARAYFDDGRCAEFLNDIDHTKRQYLMSLEYSRPYCMAFNARTNDEWIHASFHLLSTALSRLADIYVLDGDYKMALELLHERTDVLQKAQVLDITIEVENEIVVTWRKIAGVHVRQGRFFDAITVLHKALQDFDSVPDQGEIHKYLKAALYGELATTYEQAGILDKAQHFCERAVSEIDASQKAVTVQQALVIAAALHTRATILGSLGQLEAANEGFQNALRIRRQIAQSTHLAEHRRSVALTLSRLASVSSQLGELEKALSYFEEARSVLDAIYSKATHPSGHPETAVAIQNLANAYFQLGRTKESHAYFEEAVEMWERLATLDKDAVSKRAYASALARLGEAAISEGNIIKAEQLIEHSHDIMSSLYSSDDYPSGHIDLATSYFLIGSLRRRQKQMDESLEYVRKGAKMIESLYSPQVLPGGHDVVVRAESEMARALLLTNDFNGALAHSLSAEKMRQSLAVRHLVALSEAECLNYVTNKLEMCDSLVPAFQQADLSVEEMYDVIWERSGIVMRTIAARKAAIERDGDEKIKGMWEEMRLLQGEIAYISRAVLSQGNNSIGVRERVKQLTERRELLERELARSLSTSALDYSYAESWKELSRNLGRNQAFVEFFRFPVYSSELGSSKERYGAISIQHADKIRFYDLGDVDQVTSASNEFRNAVMKGLESSQSGRLLRDILWSAIDKSLDRAIDEVFVSPDDVLALVPWPALPGRESGKILIDDIAFAFVPSGHFLSQWCMDSVNKNSSERILVIGGVDYETSANIADDVPAKGSVLVGDDVVEHYPRLPGSEREIGLIERLSGKSEVTTLRGSEASVSRACEFLPKVTIAHFATHGYFAGTSVPNGAKRRESTVSNINGGTEFGPIARNPLIACGLVLAGANSKSSPKDVARGNSAILSGDAIAMLKLENLKLATLSACDSGVGITASGEGVFSLQRAFHLAGARNVVATLWKIDDVSTAAFMEDFYGRLLVGNKSPILALREAQLAAFRSNRNRSNLSSRGRIDFETKTEIQKGHPKGASSRDRNWAAFVLSGYGR